jgi:hypothetical protein
MAIFTPSESPAIVIREVDLSGVVPNVQSTTGAIVGNFRWGPVEKPILIDNEATLASIFGTPDDVTAVDFLSAAYFLKYSSSLQVVRAINASSTNARSNIAGVKPLVKNLEDFTGQAPDLDSNGNIFIARYPGSLGNSIRVSLCPVSGDSDEAVGADSAFDNWSFASYFDGSPRSSTFALANGAKNDEMHVVVVDEDGQITGIRGAVLETFPYTSLGRNAKKEDGTTNYIKDVINNRSSFIWMAGFGTSVFPPSAGTTIDAADNFYDATRDDLVNFSLDSGTNVALTVGNLNSGYDMFVDKDTITVDFLIAPAVDSDAQLVTTVTNLVGIAGVTRKDCVVVASPSKNNVVSAVDPITNVVETNYLLGPSSYLFSDNNWLKVYDKYNDKYRFIPAASSTAGLMAATDLNAAPWFSPAGERRGAYLGVTSLAYTPTKSQRDSLYKAAVNPIANIPGQGVLLYGDKTSLFRPSAFDRINVRRLFLVIERAIAIAARNVLFEFNDEFTRAEFVNIVEPFLREIKGRRGITDFRVVCDETNNTPAVIDRNEFIASVFIKPARSINYVTLNFVGVRTGVDFNEVVGLV